MRRARSIALATVAGTMLGCTGSEFKAYAPCEAEIGPGHFWGIEMLDLEMQAGDTVRSDLKDYFGPVVCLAFFEEHGINVFLAESSDPSAVAVSVSGNDLTTVAIAAADSVRVTVGTDPALVMFPGAHRFFVSVEASTGR